MMRLFSSIIKGLLDQKSFTEVKTLNKNISKIIKSKQYYSKYLNHLNTKLNLKIQLWSKNDSSKLDQIQTGEDNSLTIVEENDDDSITTLQ